MRPDRALVYARRERPRFVAELKQFVRFPSVSNQPQQAVELRRCAQWLAGHLRDIGMEQVRLIKTASHPIVYAASPHQRARPTIIIYGHYDVQPVEPLEQWRIPPFQPVVKNGNLYGRGASDDKGQLFTHVKAMESYLKTERATPVNVHCIFEGDEETGNTDALESFIQRNRAGLRGDAALISDTRMLGPGRPVLGYSQRGNLRFELEVQGPQRDLHSGNFGGAVHNPLQALCALIASLHDAEGRVAVRGFYQQVREWSEAERLYMKKNGPSDEEILRDAGAAKAWGESGYSLYERTTVRPSLDVHGLTGGYQGSGIKTVIPARASAKLSVRLVPEQDPIHIAKLIREHIARHVPETVGVKMKMLGASEAAVVDRKHPALQAAVFAYQKGFGAKPVFTRSGGSVPAAGILQRELGMPAVLMGFALPDDQIHAPNEKFHLANFFRGIETSIWYLAAAAQLAKRGEPVGARQARPV
jgi:acetylornithine deacetylase/succinyl-diaminopimelate desuccinylase-like protein